MSRIKPAQALELKLLTMNIGDSTKTFYATAQIMLFASISIIMLQETLLSEEGFRAERAKI
jgi:hypothetical protein